MKLKKSLVLVIILSIVALTSWELYWRSKGYHPSLDDDKSLWASQRARLKNTSTNDIVFIGSSRVLFDIQLNEWEKVTGTRPIMLACAGSSPLPILKDIVENTNYNGTLVVGVTPGLFFSTTFPEAMPWKRPQARIDYFHNRTYAQRINDMLSRPLQKTFGFISANEEEWSDDIDLKALLKRIKVGNRIGFEMPPFYNFSTITEDRNTRMTPRTVTDTVFSNSIKKVWQFFGNSAPPPDKDATMAFFVEYAQKFKEKGGNLILLRCPSTGYYKEGEAKYLPRNEYWDELLKKTNSKGYHYNDYKELKHFDCPEWSHLSSEDAEIFTAELAKIMLNDNVLNK